MSTRKYLRFRGYNQANLAERCGFMFANPFPDTQLTDATVSFPSKCDLKDSDQETIYLFEGAYGRQCRMLDTTQHWVGHKIDHNKN
jgi:hypothetical protein